MKVVLTKQRVVSCIILLAYLCQYVHSETTKDHHVDRTKKQLEELEETHEQEQEKELAKIYSTAKANQFLTYDKCMQRMKCPANRQEECSEECRSGNTEEEIEEHGELTKGEHRTTLSKAPKKRFESGVNSKKQSSKNKHSSSKNPSTTKPDL